MEARSWPDDVFHEQVPNISILFHQFPQADSLPFGMHYKRFKPENNLFLRELNMNLDERVYGLINPSDPRSIAAIGVRLLDRADYLVGVYLFWEQIQNPKSFLENVARAFGEARLHSFGKGTAPGLVCKMAIDVPSLVLLDERFEAYQDIRLTLLEMRASNPRPFLGLRFNDKERSWDYCLVPALSCLDSNYSYVPN